MSIVKRVILFLLLLFVSSQTFPQNKTDGWEEGSRYNKYFNASKIDTVSGKILKIEDKAPMPGMASGIELLVLSVRDTVKDTLTVQICPKWMATNLNINLKVNDEVEIEGCKAVCNGAKVFMASRLVAPGIILQLRDEKGSPIWDRLR